MTVRRQNHYIATIRALSAFYVSVLVMALSPALAGDYAHLESIGFSNHGRYFAFEEFGREDGTAFPYANFFVVDLKHDRWLKGTPIRVTVESETAGISKARDELQQKAASFVTQYQFRDNPPILVYARGLNEAYATDGKAHIAIPDTLHPRGESKRSFDLFIEQFLFEPSSDPHCPHGFELKKIASDGRSIRLHRDKKPVKSRGCVYDYLLSRFYHPDYDPTHKPHEMVGVAIISVISMGFEGADRRFIALPVPLD